MPICPLFSLPSREDTGKNRIEASQIEKKRLYIITLRLSSDVPVTPWQGNSDKVLTAEPERRGSAGKLRDKGRNVIPATPMLVGRDTATRPVYERSVRA